MREKLKKEGGAAAAVAAEKARAIDTEKTSFFQPSRVLCV